jgi:hypothetical protein
MRNVFLGKNSSRGTRAITNFTKIEGTTLTPAAVDELGWESVTLTAELGCKTATLTAVAEEDCGGGASVRADKARAAATACDASAAAV